MQNLKTKRSKHSPDPDIDKSDIDQVIGTSLRELRESRELTARQLASISQVSAAMISRIENGLVSPSISTLNALGKALDVPLVSLFRDTASNHTDYTHVKKGKGLVSTRIVDQHVHEYINLAFHARRDLQFEARLVTLVRQEFKPPGYIGHGVVFVYVLRGKAMYRYGKEELLLNTGDSISLDAELSYGISQVLSNKFEFLTVQAEKR
jgi:transcriptional regulator with XRE-family HTH domain